MSEYDPELERLMREARENDRFFSKRTRHTTGHKKYRRCREQGGTPGAFGPRSKPLRVAQPMSDPRFMSRAQREGAALRKLLTKKP